MTSLCLPWLSSAWSGTKQTRSSVASKHRKSCLLDPERRPALGSAILLPPKKCSRSLSRKINDHWSPAQVPGQQTTVFLHSPWAVKSSLHTFWVFRFPLCPAWTKPKDSCWFLPGLFCSAKCVDVAAVCLLVQCRGVLLYYEFYSLKFMFTTFFLSKQCKNATWERGTHWWPSKRKLQWHFLRGHVLKKTLLSGPQSAADPLVYRWNRKPV